MSTTHIRNALEDALATLLPAIDIVHENQAYEPVPDQPYCAAYLLTAPPSNLTVGQAFHQEQGLFQVSLFYPAQVGTLDAATRAEAIRSLFHRGATFASGGVTVQIDRTPEIGSGTVDEDRWFLPVRCRWHADIFE